MASTPVRQTPATPRPETLQERFQRLKTTWEEGTQHLSSMKAASEHASYQEIIQLGPAVVPLLLRDLEDNETHWFIALRQITGANPIKPSAAGNIPEMAASWLRWAKDNGYRW